MPYCGAGKGRTMMLLACILAWPIAGGAVLVIAAIVLSMWQRKRDVRCMHRMRKP